MWTMRQGRPPRRSSTVTRAPRSTGRAGSRFARSRRPRPEIPSSWVVCWWRNPITSAFPFCWATSASHAVEGGGGVGDRGHDGAGDGRAAASPSSPLRASSQDAMFGPYWPRRRAWGVYGGWSGRERRIRFVRPDVAALPYRVVTPDHTSKCGARVRTARESSGILPRVRVGQARTVLEPPALAAVTGDGQKERAATNCPTGRFVRSGRGPRRADTPDPSSSRLPRPAPR